MSALGTSVRPLVAGNWKMNGMKGSIGEARRVASALQAGAGQLPADIMICPPATLIASMVEALDGSHVAIGAQTCHAAASGAHTGDIAPEMLKDAGATAVIVGHSERRADHLENDRDVAAQANAAHRAGLAAIICLGETAGERRASLTLPVVRRQLEASLPAGATAENTVIAYEPIWAIGSGLTPTLGDVGEVHDAIRAALCQRLGTEGDRARILYGGSVKPSNARELLSVSNVNGALVGGASLKADDFLGIIDVYS
jgi:triosephosphate isomerase (TIM)